MPAAPLHATGTSSTPAAREHTSETDATDPDSTTIRVGIHGASGTTGTELVALLARHPHATVRYATSRRFAGRSLREVDPAAPDLDLVDPSSASPEDVDIVFTCLPHGDSARAVEAIAATGVRVIDLSGDLRLRDQGTHERVYGSRRDRSIAERAVYGLPEIFRGRIAEAEIIANPGCYPTCTALPLFPLVRRDRLRGPVIVDAKSGVSGAGRGANPLTHYCAAVDDVRPYSLGRSHRHVAEIEQTLADVIPHGEKPGHVIFQPHVVPIERGMLTTIVVGAPGLDAEAARALILEDFEDEPFIDVLPVGEAARIRAVARTNRVAIGVADVEGTDHLVLTSAIDNLGKGAAGQAVQNLNILLGLPETTGLEDARGGFPAPAEDGKDAR